MPNLGLTNENFKWLAQQLGCDPEMVMSVAKTECKRDPFDADGFPAILFERHIFYRNAPRDKRDQWHMLYPTICNPQATPAGGYGSYDDQRAKFDQAFGLNPDAAMEACSWGPFQELGANFRDYDFATVGEFVDTMKDGLGGACEIFVKSMKHRGLQGPMQLHQFVTIAMRYNGTSFRRFNYDGQLRDNYNHAEALHIQWAVIAATEPPRKAAPGTDAPVSVPEVDEGSGELITGNEPQAPQDQPAQPTEEQPTVQPQALVGPPADQPVVTVAQISPEKDSKIDQTITRWSARWAAMPAALLAFLGSSVAWVKDAPLHLVETLAISGSLTAGIYFVTKMIVTAFDKARADKLQEQREAQAHELQVLTIQSAMNKNTNTVQIAPAQIANSDTPGTA